MKDWSYQMGLLSINKVFTYLLTLALYCHLGQYHQVVLFVYRTKSLSCPHRVLRNKVKLNLK